MPYKDKEKQREATREAVKKHREGITEGITQEGITGQNVIPRYDHDLTVREILTLHSQRTQVERFPSIPLPFGEAYYELEGHD